MAVRRNSSTSPSVASSVAEISRGLVHLVEASARTAADGVRDVGGQLGQLAWRAARGTGSASVAIGGDLVHAARRAAVGTGQGIRELGQELTRLRPARAGGAAVTRPSRPTASRRRHPRRGSATAPSARTDRHEGA